MWTYIEMIFIEIWPVLGQFLNEEFSTYGMENMKNTIHSLVKPAWFCLHSTVVA